ncbi:MAG TPA: hypothetical protein VGL39_01470 [Jatrophihabitantaceae bacterium]
MQFELLIVESCGDDVGQCPVWVCRDRGGETVKRAIKKIDARGPVRRRGDQRSLRRPRSVGCGGDGPAGAAEAVLATTIRD